MNTEEKKIAVVNFYETDLIKTRKKKERVIQTTGFCETEL